MDAMNASKNEIPTLAEWAEGSSIFAALTQRFYEKVPHDPLLAPAFKNIDSHYASRGAICGRGIRRSQKLRVRSIMDAEFNGCVWKKDFDSLSIVAEASSYSNNLPGFDLESIGCTKGLV